MASVLIYRNYGNSKRVNFWIVLQNKIHQQATNYFFKIGMPLFFHEKIFYTTSKTRLWSAIF